MKINTTLILTVSLLCFKASGQPACTLTSPLFPSTVSAAAS